MPALEYVIIGFPENRFGGEIATELATLIEAGVVRIVDLVFISKNTDGSVVLLEVDENEELSMFASLDGEVGGVIGPEDIEHAAAAVDHGSSVLLIVWENRWAGPLAQAIRDAGGELIEGARIPEELVDEAEALLAEAG
jgi:hypothetical protein